MNNKWTFGRITNIGMYIIDDNAPPTCVPSLSSAKIKKITPDYLGVDSYNVWYISLNQDLPCEINYKIIYKYYVETCYLRKDIKNTDDTDYETYFNHNSDEETYVSIRYSDKLLSEEDINKMKENYLEGGSMIINISEPIEIDQSKILI